MCRSPGLGKACFDLFVSSGAGLVTVAECSELVIDSGFAASFRLPSIAGWVFLSSARETDLGDRGGVGVAVAVSANFALESASGSSGEGEARSCESVKWEGFEIGESGVRT